MSNSPTPDRTNVIALIPAYKEGWCIREVIAGVRLELDHVLVIDDGSPDDTSSKAIEGGGEVIRHEINRGKGAAIKTGLSHLLERNFDYAILLDGDGQHSPKEIPAFLEKAKESGADFIIGNRMTNSRAMPFTRRLTNMFMSAQISRLCGQKIPDTQCGFRMVSRKLIPHLLECESNAYDYETEMLFNVSRKGIPISSVPVSTIYGNEKSKINPLRDTLRFIQLLQKNKKA